MTTLTASTTVTIQAASPVSESVQLAVIPALSSGVLGKGRLVHPSLGTLDYFLEPHQWTNIDGDVLIPPIWSSAKTLSSTANTLWPGALRDVVCVESWIPEKGLSMPLSMLRTMAAFYLNPPDLAAGQYVEWYPNYTSELGFKVIIEDLKVDGETMKMSPLVKGAELVEFEVKLSLRIAERVV